MANTAQARKRVRQAEKNRQHNMSLKSAFRTAVKKVRAAIESGNKNSAQELFKAAQSTLDSMVLKGRGVITKNKAARLKSRLSAHIKKMVG